MSELSKDDLLDWLKNAFKVWIVPEAGDQDELDELLLHEPAERAYQQIKEMIKGRAEQEEIEVRYMEIILDLYERIADLCKQLEAKKRVA